MVETPKGPNIPQSGDQPESKAPITLREPRGPETLGDICVRPALALPARPIPFEPMAESLSAEQVPARLAEIRGQMKLLADYL